MKAPNPVGPTVRVLCITADLRAADFLEHELRSVAPTHKLEVVPRVDDALRRIEGTPEHDAVLIDTDVSSEDAIRLITAIRSRHLPVAIVLLVGSMHKAPPLEALEAGADDYVVKRANFTDRLYEILQRAIEGHREEAERRLHPLQMLVVGDFKQIQQHLGDVPYLRLVEGSVGADGSLEGIPSTPAGHFPYDLVLIDDVITMPRALQALKDVHMRAPDVPVVLMIEPNSGDAAIQAHKLGAAEYVVKAGNHYQRLAPVLRNIVHLRDLSRERRALRSTETRLRMLIETVPASVTVIAQDGQFMALNRAGLPLLGAVSPDQVVGRYLGSMVPVEQQARVLSFLDGICAGGRGTLLLDCRGVDNASRRLELRAVPLRRDPERTVTVLGVLRDASADPVPGPLSDLGSAVDAAASQLLSSKKPVAQDPGATVAAGQDRASQEREKSLREELKDTIEALKASQARLAARDEEYRREKEQAERERLESEGRQRALEESLEAAGARYAALEKQLEGRQREGLDSEGRQKALEESLKAAGERSADLERQLEAHQRERLESEGRQRALEESLEVAGARYADLEKQLEGRQREGLDSEGRQKALEESLKAAGERSADLEKQLDARQRELEQARREADEKTAVLQESLQSQLDYLAKADEERRLEREQQYRAQQDLQQKCLSLEEALCSAELRTAAQTQESQERLAAFEQAKAEAEKKLAEIQQSLASSSGHATEAEGQPQSTRTKEEQEQRDRLVERDYLENVLRFATSQLQERIRSEAEKVGELQRQLEESAAHSGRLERDLKSTRDRLAQLEAELQAERGSARLQPGVQHESETELEEARRSAVAQLEELKRVNEAVRADFEARLQGAAQRSLELEQQLALARNSQVPRHYWLQRSSELEHQLEELSHASEAARADFEAQLQGAAQRSSELEQQLAGARDRLAQIEAELQAERESAQRELGTQHEYRAGLEEAHRSAMAQLEELGRASEAARADFEAQLQGVAQRSATVEQELTGTREQLGKVETELMAERESAQRELAAQREYRAELEEAHRSAVAQLEALHRASAHLEVRLQEAAQRSAVLEQELAGARERFSRAEAELLAERELTQRELEAQREYRSQLEESHRSAVAQLEELTRTSEAARAELDGRLRQAFERSASLEAELQSERDRAQRELGEQQEYCAELETRLQESSQRSSQLEQDLARTRDRLLQLEAEALSERERVQRELEEQREHLARLEEARGSAVAQLEQLTQENAAARGELERRLQESAARSSQLEMELNAERERAQRELSEQAEHLAGLEEARRSAVAQLEELTRENAAARAELERRLQESAAWSSQLEMELNAERERAQRELEEQREHLAGLEEARRSAVARLEELIQENANARGELERRLQESAAWSSQLETELNAERERAQRELGEQREHLAGLEEARRSAVAQLEELTLASASGRAELESRLQESGQRSIRLEQELADAHDQLAQLESSRRSEREEAESSLAELEKRRAALEESSRLAEARLEELARENAAERSGLERGLLEAVVRASRLEQELREVKCRLEEALQGAKIPEALRTELETANRERAALAAAHQAATEKIAELIGAAEAGREEQQELRRAIEEFQEAQSAAKARFEAEIAEEREKATIALLQKQQVEEAREAAARALTAAEQRLKQAEMEYLARQEESNRLVAELRQEAGRLGESIRILEERLRQSESAQSAWKTRLEGLQAAEERLQAIRLDLEASQKLSEQERSAALQQLWRERAEWAGTRKALEESQAEAERLKTLLADGGTATQRLLKEQSERLQKVASDTISKLHQETEARLQLQAFQHAQESESLNRMLAEAGARHRQLEEQIESERRQAASSIARTRQDYERAIEASFTGLATTGENEGLVRCNAEFARLFGFAGVSSALADPRGWLERFQGGREKMRELLRKTGSFTAVPSLIRRPDGVTLRVVESAFVASDTDAAHPLVEHCFTDVTDRQLLREERQRARRVRALASLSAAVGDALQDLVALSGSTPWTGPVPGELEVKAREAAARVGGLVRQLLAACRRLDEPTAPVDLSLALQETAELMHRLLGSEAEVVVSSAPGLRPVAADRDEIDRLLVSVALEARNRLPSGGTVELSTANADFHHPLSGLEHGVQLVVSAVGYKALPLTKADAVEEVVAKCGGLLRVRDAARGLAALDIFLPGAE